MATETRSEPNGSVASPEMFSSVSTGRVSMVIVDQVKILIQDGRLKPGDRLPSERDLCTRFGVSRVTVREAQRVLEADGLIEMRLGARGGAFVTTPSSERLSERLADLLRLGPMNAAEITEARMVVELGIVPIVVERATAEDIAALREICARKRAALADDSLSVALSAEFHVRVAACTHNSAIEMLVHSFHGPLLMSLTEAKTLAPPMRRRGNNDHRDFVDAVERRDTEAAADIMRRHLQRTANRLARAT